MSAPLKSTKRTNYFEVYDYIFARFAGKQMTVLEIGVLNGGGLFMLRDLLGPEARIIGVDLNPSCKLFERFGFEIEIINQAHEHEWKKLFEKIGQVDVIIEDGGHTNMQQIITVTNCLNNIRDGGVYLSEDTHTSYWREFGNPSKRSFIEYTKTIIDKINSRGPGIKDQKYGEVDRVYSIQFFESVVCIYIDSTKSVSSERITNRGKSSEHEDYRNFDKTLRKKLAKSQIKFGKKKTGIIKSAHYRITNFLLSIIYKIENYKLRRYF